MANLLFAAPRQNMTTGSVVVSQASTITASLFRITGGPIAVWNLYGNITTAFPNDNVQFRLSLSESNALPATFGSVTTQTQTFWAQWKVGGRYYLDAEINQPMQSSDVVAQRSRPNFVRYMVPGTVLHINDNTPGGTPAAMQYFILWSPMCSASNVEGL